ncbi:MAG: hypothetical protein EPN26_00070 [Rhodospirillales bacterium]|nr:MAG: hypothetical protein EPN26_00070 [Rhodospirillales bacterium]
MNRHGHLNRRGVHRPSPFQRIFLRPANDNKAGSGLMLKRFLALALTALLALAAIWSQASFP